MPRQPRLDLPGIPQHVIQRGNDRQPCFFSSDDYERYRRELRELSLREGCAIHGYVLMTNHVHLLVTPSETDSASQSGWSVPFAAEIAWQRSHGKIANSENLDRD